MDDAAEVQQIYQQLKANSARYKPLWDDISNVVGITVQPDYMWSNQSDKATQLDEFVDDPTACVSVNQAGDYLLGIMWGTGEGVVDIIPSRYVTELVDAQLVQKWYDFATNQLLYHMNHPDAGYGTALRPYAYDQFSFGTSGIGTFKNQAFVRGIDENALLFRNYGIDNTCIDEGKGGAPDIGSTIYHWTCARIIGEFCTTGGGEVDKISLSKMPRAIQAAYNSQNYNQEFDLVFLWRPRKDFDPKLKGVLGTKFEGVWFMDAAQDNTIFCRESFRERPINMARMIRVRGEKYGRSSGTLLISTIRSLNFTFAVTTEILEKMANPALGVMGNSIFGDSVLDTSPNGLTVFNATQMAGAQTPIFPIHDVGDPSDIIKFLMPYLNEKVTSAFKIDALLDFNSAKDMTATESLQRYNIRGKSLAGMLGMQKNERVIPDVKRSISILWEIGELGVNPKLDQARAKRLEASGKTDRIVPDAVLQVAASGRPWFELKFNNELEKLTRTEEVQALTQIIQAVTAIAALYQPIVQAVDWYQLLKDLNDNLDYNNKILCTAKEFKTIIANAAAQQAAAAKAQMMQAGAGAQKDSATANKNNAQAQGMINNGQAAATQIQQ